MWQVQEWKFVYGALEGLIALGIGADERGLGPSDPSALLFWSKQLCSFTPVCHTNTMCSVCHGVKKVGKYCCKSVNIAAILFGPGKMSKFERSRGEEREGLKGISGRHTSLGRLNRSMQVCLFGLEALDLYSRVSRRGLFESCCPGSEAMPWKCFGNQSVHFLNTWPTHKAPCSQWVGPFSP